MVSKWCCAVACAAVSLRLLLVAAPYRSTDFEVHRNWLAITHSLPVSQWYKDATSPWTLDYPPLFAWFEWALSHAAKFFDTNMLVVANLDYASPKTVLFQRLSVTATDVLVLFTAAYALHRSVGKQLSAAHGNLLFLLIVGNAGLLLVDHIHFQYNGFLIGILLWSIHLMQLGHDWQAGALFAALLCTKHLFLVCGPVYFVHILRHWCRGNFAQAAARFTAMGLTVLCVFGIAFGPFLYLGQAAQIASRLFPFGRGLTHAYWAANFWALYSGADKVLAAAVPWLVRIDENAGPAMVNSASGVVGVAQLKVLPMVAPWMTAVSVLLALLPGLVALWRRPEPQRLASMTAFSCLCGFWLGYHVHEKAILPALLTLAIPATQNSEAAPDFIVLAASSLYGLLPLLFQPQEYAIKLLLVAAYCWLAWSGLAALHGSETERSLRGEACANSRTGWGPTEGTMAISGGRKKSGITEGSERSTSEGNGAHGEEGLQQGPGVERSSVEVEGAGQSHGMRSTRNRRSEASRGAGVASHVHDGAQQQATNREAAVGEAGGVRAASAQTPSDSDGSEPAQRVMRLPPLIAAYVWGFMGVEVYCTWVHGLLLGQRLPFLPLMLTSMYCALGIGWVWLRMLKALVGECISR